MLKLYSVATLLAMFPEDLQKDIKVHELTKLVTQNGTFRSVGKAIVMTESDVRQFFARVSMHKLPRPLPPALSESGYVTVIGDPAGSSTRHLVFVDWCPRGEELNLLDNVKEYADENAKVIATTDRTYGEFLKWRKDLREHVDGDWSHGKWYFRTDRVMRIFQSDMNDEPDDDEEQET